MPTKRKTITKQLARIPESSPLPAESQSPAPPVPSAPADGICHHTDAEGRRCRMLLAAGHADLCLYHWRREEQDREAVQIGAEILGVFGEIRTATAVNHALARLFAAVAQNRIPVRRAAVLGYIAQLLQHGLRSVKHEAESAIGHNAWNDAVRRDLRTAEETFDISGRDTLAVLDVPATE